MYQAFVWDYHPNIGGKDYTEVKPKLLNSHFNKMLILKYKTLWVN